MVPRCSALVLVIALVTACSHSGAIKPSSVAVFPIDGIGLEEQQVNRVRASMIEQIARHSDISVVDNERVDQTLASSCGSVDNSKASTPDCTARVGKMVGSSHVVTGAMGGLGNTYVLRLQLVDVQQATVTRVLEETVFGSVSHQQVAAADMALRLLGANTPPWYKRWWVWASAAAVVTAAIAVPLAVRDEDPYRDIQLP